MLEHGGQLRNAAKHYQIPLENWIDLSTGINPNGYPIPDIPTTCWQRLPEDEDGLLAVARDYYQTENLLAVAGSQAAIQSLPLLYPHSKVGVLQPSYVEHAACWQRQGHEIVPLSVKTVDCYLAQLDVLIIVNPNNPTADLFSQQQLLDWYNVLQAHQGLLIVDEAFIDTHPEQSLCALSPRQGLVILRSMGKFFGLAGIRCGFVMAEILLLDALQQKLGVWPLCHPSRYVAAQALADKDWQQHTLSQLPQQTQRLQQFLQSQGLSISGSHPLFQWVKTPKARRLHQQLAQQGVLTRLFKEPESLRFGLVKNEHEWLKLAQTFST